VIRCLRDVLGLDDDVFGSVIVLVMLLMILFVIGCISVL